MSSTKKIFGLLLLSITFICPVAKAEIVAHWTLDGNAIDLVGGNDGTIYGASTTTDGRIDEALLFDGINDYVEVPNSSIGNPTGSFTVTAWAKLTSESQTVGIYGDNDCIVSKHIALEGYYIEYNWDEGCLQGGLGDGSSWNRIQGTTPWEIGDWHLVALAYDASIQKIKLFDNAVKLGAITVTSPQFTSFDLRIGNSEGFANQYFPGIIDDVRIYDNFLGPVDLLLLIPEPTSICIFLCGSILIIKKRRRC